MILGTVPVNNTTFTQIIPPDGKAHTGRHQWTLFLPSGTTILADDANGTNQVSLSASISDLQFESSNETLWAKGSGSCLVIGSRMD